MEIDLDYLNALLGETVRYKVPQADGTFYQGKVYRWHITKQEYADPVITIEVRGVYNQIKPEDIEIIQKEI